MEVFGNVGVQKAKAINQLVFWDKEEATRLLTTHQLEARRVARKGYKRWVLLEKVSWRQKSRAVWLKEGDKNTRFFHKMANAHQRRNSVASVKVNGVWLT